MKISKKGMSKIILEELSVLTEKMMVSHVSDDLKDKLLRNFTQEELTNLTTYELERMLDEIISDEFLSDSGLTQKHSEEILLNTLEKIQS